MPRKTTPTAPATAHPDDIACLVRCVELGSLSAAARQRDCAVSQITRAIDRLEAAWGVRLLRRSTHGLSLTAEGARAVAHGRELLGRLDELHQLVSGQPQAVAGPVRIVLSAAIAQAWLLPALPALHAAHPALRVELVTDDRLTDLATEGADIALRTALGRQGAVIARPLARFSRALYAAPAYLAAHGTPAHPHELQRHATLTHTGLGQFNRWRFRVDGQTVEHSVGRSGPAANSTWLIQQMVQAGLGIGQLSMPLASSAVAAGTLVEVLADYRDPTRHTLHAVVLPERERTPRIAAVLDFLSAQAKYFR